jgi:hypothetical protein
MSTENKVRDALADLAPLVPAGDEALAGVRRAITRRRRRRTAVRATVAAGLLVAVATAGVLASAADDRPGETDIVGNPTTTTETVPDVVDGRVRFGPVSFVLPDGWDVIDGGDEQGGQWMCVAPAGNPDPTFADCGGLVVRHGYLPGNEMSAYGESRDTWAWSHSTDPPLCPGAADTNDTLESGPEGYGSIDEGFPAVGDKTAEYTQWAAYCSRSGDRYTPRMWVLPETRVMIEDFFNLDETEDILASFEFTDE